MLSTPASVPSGIALLVLDAGGSAPTELRQFVGEDVAFTVGEDLHYEVRGCGREAHDLARVYEKDPNNGKDVRVWHVTERGDQFFAETAQLF